MKEEVLFRIIFWALILIIIAANRILPAVRAKKSKQKVLPGNQAMKNEGKPTLLLRIVLFIVLVTFLALYSIYPPFLNAIHIPLPVWLRWLGTSLSIIGAILWIYSQAVLDRYWSPQLQIQKDHKLVTSGPYRLIRHPIYAAMFIWSIGLALLTANLVFMMFTVIAIIGLIARVPKEERMMIVKFGKEYEEYQKNTGKYFLKIRKG
jgi:protein-S-isoprenylcysteine O-methyltransferase Ste14